MIHTDGRPTIANYGSERLLDAPVVDPASTADCDGYPGLRVVSFAEAEAEALRDEKEAMAALIYGGGYLGGACCGDPGDCNECGQ